MKLTEAFKKWLRDNADVKEDAGDEEYRKAASDKIASGELTLDQVTKLCKEPDPEEGDEIEAFGKKLDKLASGMEKLVELQTKQLQSVGGDGASGDGTNPDPDKGNDPDKGGEPEGKKDQTPEWHKKMTKLFGSAGDVPRDELGEVRVKGAWEQYSTTKTAAVFPEAQKNGKPHPMAGRPIVDFQEHGRAMDVPSDLDKAVGGAYAQLLCATAQRGGSRTFGFQALPQHSKELLYHALDNFEWGGSTDGGDFADIKGRKLRPNEQKALIDDATSGGLEAAPIVFDDQVIQTPLLHGELFPLVNTIPLDRGRRIEGVSTGTVTGSWGGVDDSAISLFSTASYVSAFDTTVYRWEGAIRIGLDFLSDTPIDFSSHVSQQYGERLLEDLDDVVATGNGTTQPEGVMNKSGTTSVAFGSSNSISNIESLRFGVAKAEHRSTVANSAVFCGTETTYQRWRALAVGASDARRLFGMDHFGPGAGGYQIDGARFSVNESMANTQAFYAILARYRMYRRRGLTMRSSTEGDTLLRSNELLMVAMARYGGQLTRGGVAAVSTTLPS